MISPFEIENKEFNSKISGYDKNEVDEYLYKLSNDIENMIKTVEMKDKEISRLEDELKKFHRIEKNITEALVVAKETANEIINNAKQKSENIIDKNENKAKNIMDQANREVLNARHEFQEVKKEMNMYKIKMRSLIESQLELNESITIDE
ncbi:MAG TPA: DivIVA domain-containing protein [Clostridia bacterium]|nr:DivIVA domain-containing protein [Clostridia bacterium]